MAAGTDGVFAASAGFASPLVEVAVGALLPPPWSSLVWAELLPAHPAASEHTAATAAVPANDRRNPRTPTPNGRLPRVWLAYPHL